ncbi:hypothetical protein F5887DRAFT_956053 [Amanita rubescens]|nr:hypothetical protein F5887DRAFT_956053 [Amanita rubescens]
MDPADSDTTPATFNEHLTFPFAGSDIAESLNYIPLQPRLVLKDRLYVGNLHPTVDEYTLLQVFSKFGKITKLDFLFHKTGALKGKPRGYAFIEYGEQADALKALTKAHDKLLRGRKLVVTYAHQAPMDQESSGSMSLRHRKTVTEAGRPTTLSLIKTGVNDRRHPRTEDKIALMEAKLKQLGGSSSSEASTSIAAPAPLHPSLPAKPPPPISGTRGSPIGPMRRRERSKIHSPTPLPSLPIMPPPQTPLQTQSGPSISSSLTRSRPKLAGVKILRQKDK